MGRNDVVNHRECMFRPNRSGRNEGFTYTRFRSQLKRLLRSLQPFLLISESLSSPGVDFGPKTTWTYSKRKVWSLHENALQSSESSDFLKFNLRYLSIEEGYRYVRHGVGKPWLHTFWFWKNFGHKNSSWRTPRPNVVYSKIWNLTKIHKNRDIEKNKPSYL